jgi:hypothetical protein
MLIDQGSAETRQVFFVLLNTKEFSPIITLRGRMFSCKLVKSCNLFSESRLRSRRIITHPLTGWKPTRIGDRQHVMDGVVHSLQSTLKPL